MPVAVACQRLIPFADPMTALFVALLASLRAMIRSRLELAAEILALRHQLAVLQRTTPKRPRLRPTDRLLWVLLSRIWPNWRQAVHIVTPATVVRWHRRAFAACARRSETRPVGRSESDPPEGGSFYALLIRHENDRLWECGNLAFCARFPSSCGNRSVISIGACVPSMFYSLEVKVLCPGLVETKG